MDALHRFTPQVLLILGLIILLLSYFADVVGIGSPGFGTRQHFGMLFGLILIVNGVSIWAIRDRK